MPHALMINHSPFDQETLQWPLQPRRKTP
jgi:hypothetical protein